MIKWLPITIIYYIIHSVISYKVNIVGGWKWGAICYALGFIPLWLWVCMVSDNLLRDGLIFDTVLVVTCALTYAYLGYGSKFTVLQWVGVAVAVIGFLIIQLGGK